MKTKNIKVGQLYAWTTNSISRVVRVIRKDTRFFSVIGAVRSVPYNFALAKDMRKANIKEYRRFLEDMPVR